MAHRISVKCNLIVINMQSTYIFYICMPLIYLFLFPGRLQRTKIRLGLAHRLPSNILRYWDNSVGNSET